MNPAESLLTRTIFWATAGAAAGFPALVVPAPADPRSTLVIHLAVLTAFLIGFVFHLAVLADRPWFAGTSLGPIGRQAASWAVTGAAATACAATVAAATALGLRYDASMQYLVVLGADAVALPMSLAVLGARRRFGPMPAAVIGAVVSAAVVWSLWRYLDVVGTGPGGAWIVDGSRLGTIVLPVVAGALAVGFAFFTLGVRSAD